MDEQSRQVLEMLAEGKVTVEEAERLIGALSGVRTTRTVGRESGSGAVRMADRPKYLRVVVTAEEGAQNPAVGRVNVRVPMQLLRAGVRLTSLIPPQALSVVNQELSKAGVPVDLSQLKPQDLEELIDQLADINVAVDNADGLNVRVFAE